jgi:hypothetical protein
VPRDAAGVVDQHVHRPEAAPRLAEHGLHIRPVRDVRAHRQHAAGAAFLARACGELLACRDVARSRDDVGALACEADHEPMADSTAAARDDHCPAAESEFHAQSSLGTSK